MKAANTANYLTGITGFFYSYDDIPTKGCFSKGDSMYFGIGGTYEELNEIELLGDKKRILCDDEETGESLVDLVAQSWKNEQGLADLLLQKIEESLSSSPSVSQSWSCGPISRRRHLPFDVDRRSYSQLTTIYSTRQVCLQALAGAHH